LNAGIALGVPVFESHTVVFFKIWGKEAGREKGEKNNG
jgi:hypothetical protein